MHTCGWSPRRRCPSRGPGGPPPLDVPRARQPVPPCPSLPLPCRQQRPLNMGSGCTASMRVRNSCGLWPLQGAPHSVCRTLKHWSRLAASRAGQGLQPRRLTYLGDARRPLVAVLRVQPVGHVLYLHVILVHDWRQPVPQLVLRRAALAVQGLGLVYDCTAPCWLLARSCRCAGAWQGKADVSMKQRMPAGPPAAARRPMAQASIAQVPAAQRLTGQAAVAQLPAAQLPAAQLPPALAALPDWGALHPGRICCPSTSAAAAAPAARVLCLQQGASKTGSIEIEVKE